jgi:hypothetical protein
MKPMGRAEIAEGIVACDDPPALLRYSGHSLFHRNFFVGDLVEVLGDIRLGDPASRRSAR